MIMPSKDNLYNSQKGIGFENPSYFEKAKDLRPTLYDEKVISLGYTSMFLTHSDEALEIENFKRSRENKIEFAYDYGNMNASYVNEKINFEDDYFQNIINPDFEKIDFPFQQTSSLKPYVPNVILEKIIIDFEDEVVSLLEKEKENLETIESLKSKGFESSENVSFESENQTENDCLVVEKECDKEENPKVIAPMMFKLNVSHNEIAKDLWDALERQMRGSEYGEQDRKAAILYEYETFKANEGEQLLVTYLRYLQEWKQYATLMRQTKNLMDINIDALYNILKQNQRDVNDAVGYKKKAVVVTLDPLALVVEKTNVSKRKEKVVVYSDSKGSGTDDFSELKKITLAKAFNRRKFYLKPTNNNLRTSSTSQSANKKQEFVKTDDKKVKRKADEKKRDLSKVKCYNCKKERHFAKDCKKAKVKDYNFYKTKMLLAKKDSDEQVLLAQDQAWMESNSDADQEINANIVFMAQIEKVLSESDESSSSAEETIAEVAFYTSKSESESEFETSEYYDNSTNYGLFVNNDDDDQEIFHDAIESASENFFENHIDSQKDYNKSEVDHNDSEEKEHLVDKLIQKFNHKIAKCQKRIEKANQQSKDFENQNKDLQEKYDVLINKVNTFEEQNNEFNDQIKVLNEKIYSALFDNDKQHRKQIANQEVLFDKMGVELVELDKHVRDLKNTVLGKDFKISELEECVCNKDLEIEKCLERIGFENPSYFEKAKDLRPTLYDEKVIGLGYTPMFLTHSDEALEIEKFKRSRENKIKFSYDYGNLNASYVNEKIKFEDDYFQEIINPDFEKIDSPFQQTSSLKLYVSNVILEKIIIDLEDEVVSLLEKEKENLKTIESLKSNGFESSENAIFESENQSENDCHVVEKECDKMENSNVIAPGLFKLSASQSVSPMSMSKTSCEFNNVESKLKRKRRKRKSSKQNDKQVNNDVSHANSDFVHFLDLDTFSSVRRPKSNGVIWKKKGSSNTSNVDLSFVSHLKLNKDKTQVNLQLQVQLVRNDNGTKFKNKTLAKLFDEFDVIFSMTMRMLESSRQKRDIEVSIGYSKKSAAFRIYNKRTRKIHESVNVNFDEISEMASKQFNLEPGLSNLNKMGKSLNPSVSQVSETTKKDLEDLFHNFSDEYFDSSKIMKSLTTNVETSITRKFFMRLLNHFKGNLLHLH
nr:hypothetical protein [Tanacetum cinerariifolium]